MIQDFLNPAHGLTSGIIFTITMLVGFYVIVKVVNKYF